MYLWTCFFRDERWVYEAESLLQSQLRLLHYQYDRLTVQGFCLTHVKKGSVGEASTVNGDYTTINNGEYEV